MYGLQKEGKNNNLKDLLRYLKQPEPIGADQHICLKGNFGRLLKVFMKTMN